MRASNFSRSAVVSALILGGFLMLAQDKEATVRKSSYDPLFDAIQSIDRIGNWEATPNSPFVCRCPCAGLICSGRKLSNCPSPAVALWAGTLGVN